MMTEPRASRSALPRVSNRSRRNAVVFVASALLGGAVAWATPAGAYARHIDAFGCLPLYSPLQVAPDNGLTNQFGAKTYLGFYCPFNYDTALLASKVKGIAVDLNTTGNNSGAAACYTSFDGSSNGCGTWAASWGNGTAQWSNPQPSPALWQQDPDKVNGSRYTFVGIWIGGGDVINGVYVWN